MTTTLTAEQRQAAIALLSRLPRNVQAAAIERARRERISADIVASMHPMQLASHRALQCTTYMSVCAGRRGGKTRWACLEIALSLQSSGRGEWTVYLAPTAQVGKELVWADLVELNDHYELGWKMAEHPIPTITTKTGARFRICGCDDKGQLGKLRGKIYRLAIIDEAKELSPHLEELVDEVFGPAFMGVGGKMVVTGTPGRHRTDADYWYSICHGLRPGWAHQHFTLRDNPWIKDADKALAKVREEKQWTEDNVVYQREYLGLWISDLSERVYAYQAPPPGSRVGRNAVDGLPPHYDRDTWTHVMGIDFGYDPDPCAWVVMASHPNEKDVYVVYAEKGGQLLPDEVASHTAELIKRYRPSAVVGDSGGLGKPYVAEWNRRHADAVKMWIKAAEKLGKRDHQEMMSEELRAGRIKVCLPQAECIAEEWLSIGWKDSYRMVEHQGAIRHAADAGLYAFFEMHSYWNKPLPTEVVKPPEQVAAEALAARQQKAAFAKKAGAFGGGRR